MKKKNGSNGFIVTLIVLAVVAGGIFAASHNWKTGENAILQQIEAQTGDPDALYQLGLKAQGDKAVAWFEKAAAKGHVKAMLALGDHYDTVTTEEAGDQAIAWYQKASDAGSLEAKRKLAAYIGIGRGKGEPDIQRADKLMGEAAAAGDGKAQLIFGRNFAGAGQYEEAETWLLKASAQGVKGSSAALGNLYYNHYSRLKDDAKALQWLGKAAEEGDTRSQLDYSYMYYSGRGVTQDRAEAYKWLLLADPKREDVDSALDWLRPQLKPAEAAEGEKRAAAWKTAHQAKAS
ncbi:tetratricopeptide repeat protein [Asticcacaulis benevestitus]|uniref:Sel1 repeat family protein n=1 Tax=Asticcacaulis benevestitus DSM 16100 = ATCC BAA-896 TaxID=1121022 RepID=V4RM92_9CAUL|nr:tetratricopeptide repeat protein [Asticcacaulis benevestitus]ESQ92398.1 hypothetical protein ABENE_08455 [Asticcacaulis benevestitus DSM 16100 = ATCC BAA-896]